MFGKFPNQQLYQSKFWLLIGKFVGYNQNFDFCPSCQSNLFLVTQFMLAIWEILPLAPILCSNLWLVVLLNRKFLLFLSPFGMLAINAMAFWEILIFSQQNPLFLKNCQRGYVNTIKQAYCLHLNKCKLGIFRGKIPHIMQIPKYLNKIL